MLLLGHGGGSSKDAPRFVELCRRYATATGLAVVCIDAVDHGERRRPLPPGVVPDGAPPEGWHSSVSGQMTRDWQAAADAVADIGPAVAYVGFSMGAVFGVLAAPHLATIQAAVLVVGGIPEGGGIVDPRLRPMLLDAAARLDGVDVLMANKTGDDIFPATGVRTLYDAIPGQRKRLAFSPGDHDDWSADLIDDSVAFLRAHLRF